VLKTPGNIGEVTIPLSFTTDTGGVFTWPRRHEPFKPQRDVYEGLRVPAIIRWPGMIKPAQWRMAFSGLDWFRRGGCRRHPTSRAAPEGVKLAIVSTKTTSTLQPMTFCWQRAVQRHELFYFASHLGPSASMTSSSVLRPATGLARPKVSQTAHMVNLRQDLRADRHRWPELNDKARVRERLMAREFWRFVSVQQ